MSRSSLEADRRKHRYCLKNILAHLYLMPYNDQTGAWLDAMQEEIEIALGSEENTRADTEEPTKPGLLSTK